MSNPGTQCPVDTLATSPSLCFIGPADAPDSAAAAAAAEEEDLLLLSSMKAKAPTTARDPTMVPTAMPAMAPLLRPPPDPEDDDELDVGVTVAAATVSVAVASPESKSAAVTLKQGTWAVKSAASTRVWCWWWDEVSQVKIMQSVRAPETIGRFRCVVWLTTSAQA